MMSMARPGIGLARRPRWPAPYRDRPILGDHDGEDSMRRWRAWRPALGVPTVVALLAGIVVVCNVGAALPGDEHTTRRLAELPGVAPVPGTAADCERVVLGLIAQVPDAWGYGLLSGVSDQPLRQRYGAASREVRTFHAVQSHILAFFHTHGYVHVPQVLASARPRVRAGCAAST